MQDLAEEMLSQHMQEMANLLRAMDAFLCNSRKCECLPLLLGFMAESCFVKYDTQEEQITNIGIILVEKNGFIIEADPINACIRGYFADEICGSIQMREPIAKTLRACIQACWKKRLSTEYLVRPYGGGRYIAADLFA